MSPTLKKYYDEKYRKLGFYISQNEEYLKESPPEISFVVGLEIYTDKKSTPKYIGPKDMEDKNLPMKLGQKKPGPADGYIRRPKQKCPCSSNIWETDIGRNIPRVFL